MPIVTLIGGSPSAPSRSSAVLHHIAQHLQAQEIDTHMIAVRDLDPLELLHGQWNGATITPALQAVSAANAVIIATPVYKASYTGILKAFLDLLPMTAFTGKLVMPIATGGSPAHLLMLDYALKPVISTLGARFISRGIYIQDGQIEHTNGTNLRFLDAEAEGRLKRGLDYLVRVLQHNILDDILHDAPEDAH